jgi:Zn-dependent peptidase ImmA (M78 family)
MTTTKATPLWGKTTTEVDIFGERLRDARVIQRLKAQVVAERVGIAPDRYSRFERSVSTTVDIVRARHLASALDFSVDFLAAPPITPVQRGSLLFRAKTSMTRGEEDQLVAWARLVGDLIHRSLEESVRLPYLRLPRLTSEASPQEAARMTRQALGIQDDAPIPHLTRTLERGGVYVAALDFSGELHAKHHDAFSTWVGPTMDWALIGIRATSSWERTRLSVAHEVGHLVMHYIRRGGDIEAEAYAFGAELLFPGAVLRDCWPGSPTLMSLLPLKRAWGMSLSGLIEHGYRNSLLNQGQRTSLYKQLSNKKDRGTGERWRIREPGWREREPERPKLIAKVAEAAFGPDVDLNQVSDSIYSWRSDLICQLLAQQVTSWARSITADCRVGVNHCTSGDLAPVIELTQHADRANRNPGSSSTGCI